MNHLLKVYFCDNNKEGVIVGYFTLDIIPRKGELVLFESSKVGRCHLEQTECVKATVTDVMHDYINQEIYIYLDYS